MNAESGVRGWGEMVSEWLSENDLENEDTGFENKKR